MRGKHRYPRRRGGWSIPDQWRRPLSALGVLSAGVLLVVTGLVVGRLLIVWALLATCALIAGLVLLAGDSGPEWPDWPLPEHPRSHDHAGRGADEWNGARRSLPTERRTPAR